MHTITTFNDLQDYVSNWSDAQFGADRGLDAAVWKLTGVQEELGEVSHAILKSKQGIRTNEDHLANVKDGVGDLMVYLVDFCKCMNITLEDCVNTALQEVDGRDWKKYPETGKPNADTQV